ncbi:MAG: Rne/Rng family ribonuclease [Verrucomicrobiales bacterium]
MIHAIKRLFGMGSDLRQGVKIVVNKEKLEARVAFIEDGVLEEYTIERADADNIVGSIFTGKVRNLEAGLKAMFVDIGMDKNAFLHYWDALPAALDEELETIERAGRKPRRPKISAKDIPNIYPVGSEVMVQVTKGAISNKGPRVTTNISLPGRFMVLMPRNDQFGISRKIEDPKERVRLKKIMQKLSVPEGMGIILRTAAQGMRARFFVRDLAMLLEQWQVIEQNNGTMNAPARLFAEPSLVERTVRDFLTDEVDEVICDDAATTERMKDVAGSISRRSKRRIRYLATQQPIFDYLGIQKQIDNAFFRQVWLRCGGYIVIDETEAMIAIDVNTGRNKGAKDVERTLLETNLEAAEEVARQVRLRNIGGLIVVDFIDMKGARDRQAVFKMMKDRLKRDKAKTQVLPISQFGLMEMTRQRLHESLSTSVFDLCPYCSGHGRIKSPTSMSVELQRKLHAVLPSLGETNRDVVVTVHPDVMQRLRSEDADHLLEIERRHLCRLTFRSDPGFHREKFVVSNSGTGEELAKS